MEETLREKILKLVTYQPCPLDIETKGCYFPKPNETCNECTADQIIQLFNKWLEEQDAQRPMRGTYGHGYYSVTEPLRIEVKEEE